MHSNTLANIGPVTLTAEIIESFPFETAVRYKIKETNVPRRDPITILFFSLLVKLFQVGLKDIFSLKK